mmetsp:Transcript_1866/g.2550  ORF Transcript_1866/g.2550 Transcript_1866/m.2550 type:complete len:116 (-) Transcript_1866:1865-2212(-)
MHYNSEKHLLSCLSSAEKGQGCQKLEVYTVQSGNQDVILKKLVRTEKRKALKRSKNFGDTRVEDLDKEENFKEQEDAELPTQKKVDKDKLRELIKLGDYDIGLHFTKVADLDLEA